MVGSAMMPVAPALPMRLAAAMASLVVYSATPAITGTRPFTAFTAAATTASFSSSASEEFSPSVPSITKPSQPALRQDSMCLAVASRSRSPFCFISVINAGMTPRQVSVISEVLQ